MTDLLEQKRCPQCYHPPEVEYASDQYWLSCDYHGHMATGPTMELAIANWNHYVVGWVALQGESMMHRMLQQERVL